MTRKTQFEDETDNIEHFKRNKHKVHASQNVPWRMESKLS